VFKIVTLDPPEFVTDKVRLLLLTVSTFPKLSVEGKAVNWPNIVPVAGKTSTRLRLYRSPVGAVSFTVTVVPLAGMGLVSLCTQKVLPTGDRYSWIMVWFGPTVREVALSQSMPTPTAREPFMVVTSEAVGAPGLALPVPIAPIAPDPFVPLVFTPVKLMTVIEALTFCVNVAVTVTPLRVVVANARQISAVPRWTFVLSTRAQVNPPPAMLLTETLGPPLEASDEMNARSSSFAEAMANDGDAIVVALVPPSVDLVTSMEIGGGRLLVKLKLAGELTPATLAVTI
jgi:hypothetical protein